MKISVLKLNRFFKTHQCHTEQFVKLISQIIKKVYLLKSLNDVQNGSQNHRAKHYDVLKVIDLMNQFPIHLQVSW